MGPEPLFERLCRGHDLSCTNEEQALALIASETIRNHAAFIWSVADLLRGDYKQSEYGKVILPLTVLRRLDCVLEPTKQAVLDRARPTRGQGREPRAGPPAHVGRAVLQHLASTTSASSSPHPTTSPTTCAHYIASFSSGARDVLDKFDFDTQITRLDRANLLYLVVSKFAEIDLHPDAVSNLEMGYLYEELIRRFSELSNETAGEHFTPREVIRLMVNLLFIEDEDLLTKPGIVKTMLDPACGTGGMLSVAEDHLRVAEPERPAAGVRPGAERRDLRDLPLGHDAQGPGRHQHRLRQQLQRGRPPGRPLRLPARQPAVRRRVEEGRSDVVRDEHESKGFAGRFGAGLPRINDGSFLFLQHMISKMKPVEQGGSRLAIVFNGSPLFTGGGRIGRVGDPPLDHRERLAGGRRRPAGPALLQHRHLHVLLDRHQPQVAGAPGQGAVGRRPRVLRQDAQEPRREAQGDQRRRRSTRSSASTASSPRATG